MGRVLAPVGSVRHLALVELEGQSSFLALVGVVQIVLRAAAASTAEDQRGRRV